MAHKNVHRAQARREKQRLKREEAQSSRRARTRESLAGGVAQAARWPTGDCYLSSNWPEQSPVVHAVFTRRHDNGRVAAVFAEVDLADRGVFACQVRTNLVDQALHQELAQRSSEERPLMALSPALVVKVVAEGRRVGQEGGHEQPASLADAFALFADIDGGGAPQELLTGRPRLAPPPAAAPEPRGLLAGLRKRLGL